MAWNLRRNDYHWNYFLLLEEDVVRIARFIEPHQANFGSYSIELLSITQIFREPQRIADDF